MSMRHYTSANHPREGTVLEPSFPNLIEDSPFFPALFPVLASTHLCVDLLLQTNAFALRTLTELLSRDPGAVLRLFALVAHECPKPEDRPERLEDCIAIVQSEDLLKTLCDPLSSRQEQALCAPIAQHGFTIACFARMVASSLGLEEERAFLIGLLHAIGTLPVSGDSRIDPAGHALALARRHQLPSFLCQALPAVHRKDPGSVWTAMVDAAHDLAAKGGYLRKL